MCHSWQHILIWDLWSILLQYLWRTCGLYHFLVCWYFHVEWLQDVSAMPRNHSNRLRKCFPPPKHAYQKDWCEVAQQGFSGWHFLIHFHVWEIYFSIKLSLISFKGWIKNKPALYDIMSWWWAGNGLLSVPITAKLTDAYMHHAA